MSNEPATQPTGSNTLVKELYFPTQIFFRDLPDAAALNDRLTRSILAWRDSDPEGIERSNVREAGSWHSPVDMHTRQEYLDLTRPLFETISQVYKHLAYDPACEPVCDSMWANISPRHGMNRLHTHPNVLWSGVYYVQTPPRCGRIYFHDPRPQAQVLVPRVDRSQARPRELWSEVFFEPRAGRVIFFPAWLGHEVQPNLSDEPGTNGLRISVSFNFFQRCGGTGAAPEFIEVKASDLAP